ncbi:hypothetical protein V8J88_00710 [Massilia sp. W12]|uniref:hypothetical protein n=1 Tax=Massilia sp. W12 TaxID=3126507 RepID=UPI0030CF48F0
MLKLILLLLVLAMVVSVVFLVRRSLAQRARRMPQLRTRDWSETVYACAESRAEF